MYKVGDIIIYTLYGICTITEETERFFNGQNLKYYVLVPLADQKTKMTIPQNNPIILERVHSLLSADEINAILQEIPFLENYWIDNDNQRRREFGDIVKAGHHKEILQMMKSIFAHSVGLKDRGRKLHAADEQCLKDGEKLILDEFAYVLKKDRLVLAEELRLKFQV